MPFIFLAFVLVPIAEIGLFIEVGGILGLWPTLSIVILTAFLGTALLRMQGLAAFSRAQNAMAEGRLPMEEVVHGFCLVVAGALLLTPGFLTDAIGFLLFMPPVRLALGRAALRWFSKHGTMHVYNGPSGAPRQDNEPGGYSARPRSSSSSDILEGEAEEVDVTNADRETKSDQGTSNSPWKGPSQ
jgi:UPF0716 protein FxsA